MSSNTPNLGLLKKDPMVDGNETFNIETMLNENWDKIDEAVGQVREDLGNIDVEIPDASLIQKGIVQLSSATNGARENVAATEKAVKAAYDRGSAGVTAAATAQSKADSAYTEAAAAKQLGVEQKNNVVAALNSIGVAASTSETWAQLVAKMAGVIKATGNATAGDILAGKTASNASGVVTGTMINRGAQILSSSRDSRITIPQGYHNGSGYVTPNYMLRSASGTVSSSSTKPFYLTDRDGADYWRSYISVSGLGFKPSSIFLYFINNGNNYSHAQSTLYRDGMYVNGYQAVYAGMEIFRVDGTQAYVRDGSFLLPVSGSVDARWYAYE